jgi:hypothetical protein
LTTDTTPATRTMLPFEQWKIVTMLWQRTQAGEPRPADQILHNCFGQLDDLVELQQHHCLIDAHGVATSSRVYQPGQRVDLAADVPPRPGINVNTALANIRLRLTGPGATWIDRDPHSRAVRAIDAYASPQLVRRLVQQNSVDPEALVRLAEAQYAEFAYTHGCQVEPAQAGQLLRQGGIHGQFGDLTAKLTTKGAALAHPVV